MFYLVKTPWWIKRIYLSYLWSIPVADKSIYLTFDDGPHPEVTPFVLDQLKEYNALATFFCIGKNVQEYPMVYKRILEEGHSVGNHTQNHLNGWKTNDKIYLENISEAAGYIDSNLFRPPYGKITKFQANHLSQVLKGKKPQVVMWDIISGDFDISVSPKRCLENVIFNARPGSIIVFHDSKKAFPRLEYALPGVLKFLKKENFLFKSL